LELGLDIIKPDPVSLLSTTIGSISSIVRG
jgi:hypothetical protein